MSKYQVDKVMREIILDDTASSAFKANAVRFLEGHDLTREERDALISVDYAALYRLGAHPFLLNAFTPRVWKGDKATLRAEYRNKIAPFGYPDFST
jgi:Aromatic-ring-opening dioxygenase LigAB, LigA subunit